MTSRDTLIENLVISMVQGNVGLTVAQLRDTVENAGILASLIEEEREYG